MQKSFQKAIEQIDDKLAFWNKFVVHKCKQRLTKLTEMLRRMRRLKLKGAVTLEKIKQKTERRDLVRLDKAEQRAHIENEIETELLERLKNGTYGELYDDLVNLNKKVMNKHIGNQEILDASLDESFNSAELMVNLEGY